MHVASLSGSATVRGPGPQRTRFWVVLRRGHHNHLSEETPMNTLRSLRPLLVWVGLGATGASSLFGLLTFFGFIENGLSMAASVSASSLMSPIAALVVLASVLLAVLLTPAMAQARTAVIVGLAIVAGFGALSVLFALIGLGTLGSSSAAAVLVTFLRQLINLAVPAVVALTLVKLLAEVPAPTPAIGGQPGFGAPTSTQVPEPSGQYPQQQAPQQQEQGAGAMWGTANQAASGASASSWQGQPAGDWGQQQPAQPQPSAPQQQQYGQPSASQPYGHQAPAPQQPYGQQQPGHEQYGQPQPQQPQAQQPQAQQPQAQPSAADPQQGGNGWYPVQDQQQGPGGPA